MKLRYAIIFSSFVLLLAACNFTLAADVTPPPGYVSPTPPPTVGPLFPTNKPDPNNGAIIFAEKCLPCHGASGLGDGPQSLDLPVSVIAIGLPDIASKASPSSWYSVVTKGNLERFMPPFNSLNDQERWDVVAYALTLHTTPEQIETGKAIFEARCFEDCKNKFNNIEQMSGLSEEMIINMVENYEGYFGSDLTQEEATAVAMYIRTLTFASLQPTPTVAPVTETVESAEVTPVDGTQIAATPEANQIEVVGSVRGTVDNQTGGAIPSNLKVTLHGYEHGADPSASPQEVLTVESTVNVDGTFLFENVEIPVNRIFLAEIDLNGMKYRSEFAVIEQGMTSLDIAPVTIYETTEDFSILQIQDLQFYFDYANENNVQILAVYSILNATNKTVVVKNGGTQEIPFIKMPNGLTIQGYETAPDSAEFLSLGDDGFAIPPNEVPYGIIAFTTAPKAKSIAIEQPIVLPVTNVMLLVPSGVDVESTGFTNAGPHEFNGNTFNLFNSGNIQANETISFTLSGEPKSTSVNPDVTQNQSLLIGIGALGIAFILAGAWMYWRDRKRANESDEDGYVDSESVMDAIIALDDQHRAGKLSDAAYKKRREELKNDLKRKN